MALTIFKRSEILAIQSSYREYRISNYRQFDIEKKTPFGLPTWPMFYVFDKPVSFNNPDYE